MYFDNDYVRVLTIHSHTQLLSLLANHSPTKHILLHLSCSNCATCNSLDNEFASLSLQYPADCLFLRCNIAKLTETAQWAGVDLEDVSVSKPIVRILAAAARPGDEKQQAIDVMALHEPLGSSDSAVQGMAEEIKDLLVNKLRAVHFNDWSGDASSNLIDARVSAHHLLHDHDHEEYDQGSPLSLDQMPASMATILKTPTTTTPLTDSGRASSEELAHDPSSDHNCCNEDGDACAASDEDGDHDHNHDLSEVEEEANYEADDDEDICPCCRDRMAVEPLSSASRSLSRSRTRSRSSCTDSSSSSSEFARVTRRYTREGPRVDTGIARREDQSLSNDIDDVMAIGDSGSIPASPLVGRVRHQLPVSPLDTQAAARDSQADDPLTQYVDRLEAMKRGDALPSETTGTGSAVWKFVVDNLLSLLSLVILVVALALTVRIEIVPAGANVGR